MKSLSKKFIVSCLTHCSRRVLARYAPSVVAITGSAGKTSTKDAVRAVLARQYRTRGSEKSFNSELGVPLTILGLANAWKSVLGWFGNLLRAFFLAYGPRVRYPEWLVLEVGADRPGDITRIMRYVKPIIAIITCIGEIPVHVENFPTPRDLAREKSLLANALPENGMLILNADDNTVSGMDAAHKGPLLRYGFSEGADVRASHTQIMYEGNRPVGLTLKVDAIGKSIPLRLPDTFGEHNVGAALAALAVGITTHINPLRCAEALQTLVPPRGRLRLIDGVKGTLILDDSYNASPVAVIAALDTVEKLRVEGRKISILGDMMELGVYAPEAHRAVGKRAAKVLDALYLVGTRAKFIGEGAREEGMATTKIKTFDESAAAGRALEYDLKSGDLILVKGSQYVRMERAIYEIMAEPSRASELLVRQEEEWKKR